MMFGMMPLIRLQLARTEPEAITAMAIFLSECMQRIGNPEVATDDMAKWLTELT